MLRRAPHVGWYVVLTLMICILLAAGSAIYGLHARQVVQQAREVMDTLAAKQCILVSPGADVRVFPPRADTLKRARP